MRILNTQYDFCMEGAEKHSNLNQLSLHLYFFEDQRPHFFIPKFKNIKYLFFVSKKSKILIHLLFFLIDPSQSTIWVRVLEVCLFYLLSPLIYIMQARQKGLRVVCWYPFSSATSLTSYNYLASKSMSGAPDTFLSKQFHRPYDVTSYWFPPSVIGMHCLLIDYAEIHHYRKIAV